MSLRTAEDDLDSVADDKDVTFSSSDDGVVEGWRNPCYFYAELEFLLRLKDKATNTPKPGLH